jgi:hypothetical protein
VYFPQGEIEKSYFQIILNSEGESDLFLDASHIGLLVIQ